MYWADSDTAKVLCSDLDGSNVRDVISGGGGPRCIVLHLQDQKMYWNGIESCEIYRANLDGTQVETVVTGHGGPCGLALVID